ncbi:MAG: squalene synthase HpnC [Methylophilaceae bacterium]
MDISNSTSNAKNNTELAHQHYENFPVASLVLPKHLRHPVALIYNFARQADDFADEGNYKPEHRLAMLKGFKKQLDMIKTGEKSNSAFFVEFGAMIRKEKLPLQPFYDLLNAFSQDVTKAEYANFDEVLDYCDRSANPIGILLLHLFDKVTPENLVYSNNVCTALQLINFYQDIAIDFDSTYHEKRIYLCQDEMEQYDINEAQIATQHINLHWERFMMFNIERAEAMLKAGKPLEDILPGRMGLEMRMIIGGGEQIIYKLKKVRGDIFKHRPTLKAWDWPLILLKTLL